MNCWKWVKSVLSVRREAPLRGFGDAKVDDHRHGLIAIGGHQDIIRLEIAMDDAFVVGVLDGEAHLFEKCQPFIGAEAALVTVLGDGHATDEFHDKVGPAGFGGAGIEHLGDVGVLHERQRLAFGFEAGHDLFRVHAQLENLERDSPRDGGALLRHVDHPVTALTDLLQHFVRAKGRTDEQVRRVGGVVRRTRIHGGPPKIAIHLQLEPQPKIEARPQGCISRAGFVQESLPLGFREFESPVKESLLAILLRLFVIHLIMRHSAIDAV